MKSKLKKAKWADISSDGKIEMLSTNKSIQMKNSDGIGIPLLSYKIFGADLIQFGSGKGVRSHVHVGDHILFVLQGNGILEYDDEEHVLYPGLCYLVLGNVKHAIRAIDELTLIAIGNNHQPLDSEERMTPVNDNNLK